jgi:hypothetical protein
MQEAFSLSLFPKNKKKAKKRKGWQGVSDFCRKLLSICAECWFWLGLQIASDPIHSDRVRAFVARSFFSFFLFFCKSIKKSSSKELLSASKLFKPEN